MREWASLLINFDFVSIMYIVYLVFCVCSLSLFILLVSVVPVRTSYMPVRLVSRMSESAVCGYELILIVFIEYSLMKINKIIHFVFFFLFSK